MQVNNREHGIYDMGYPMTIAWRKWLLNCFCIFIIIFTFFNLSHTLTDMAMEQNQGWEVNAKTHAQMLIDSLSAKSYCIVSQDAGRMRLVYGDFDSLDIRTVINNEIKRRVPITTKRLGKELFEIEIRGDHFGILINNKFYFWSFTEQRFFDGAKQGYNGSFYNSYMLQTINRLFDPNKTPEQQAESIGKYLGHKLQFNPYPTLTDDICPEYLPDNIPEFEIIPYKPSRNQQYRASK